MFKGKYTKKGSVKVLLPVCIDNGVDTLLNGIDEVANYMEGLNRVRTGELLQRLVEMEKGVNHQGC